MKAPLKHTIIAMATAALGFAAGCAGDEAPEATEASSGGEQTATEASCAGAVDEAAPADEAADPAAADPAADAEAACGEGSCG